MYVFLPKYMQALWVSLCFHQFQVVLLPYTKFFAFTLPRFNTAVMAFKAVNKISPLYLSKHLPLIQNPNGVSTRANKQKKLRVTKVHNNFDKKTFLYNATKIWNDLPNELRTSQSLVTFKSKAKSHFFDV